MTSPDSWSPGASSGGFEDTKGIADWLGLGIRDNFNRFADVQDGQNALNGRLDEIASTSGHCATVMGRNWKVPFDKWVQVPFDVQVGESENAAVSPSPSAVGGTLTMQKPGVWDLDVLVDVRGFTEHYQPGFSMNGIWYPDQWRYDPIAVEFELTVVSVLSGVVITAKRHRQQTGALISHSATSRRGEMLPQSAAFTHTFVLPPFPTPPYPDYPFPHVYAGLSMRATKTSSIFSTSLCEIYGGTAKSGLTASRWSKDVDHANYQPTVDDGGTLA